jgi:branched-chain amino acid transport system substrate-binding protein
MRSLKNYQKIFFILTLLIFYQTGFGQQDSDVKNQFDLAIDLYKSGDFKDALKGFNKIATQLPYNTKTSIAYLFLGKTYIQLNDFNSAKQYLQDFLEKFPASEYGDEAQMALVKVFYEQQNYKSAFEEILNLVSKAHLPGYKTYAESIGDTLAMDYLEFDQLNNYSEMTKDSALSPYLLLLTGKKLEQQGNYSLAADTFNKLITSYPESLQRKTAEKFISKLNGLKNNGSLENLLGILLPLTDDQSGETVTAAKEMLEGIKYAVALYNKNHNSRVGLLIRDTGNDSLKISEIKNEIAPFLDVKAIIGPVFSDEVRAALKDFDGSGIPIVSPTATDDDLTGLSDDFFQANPSFSMRGKLMAQYIFFVTGKRKISVLNAGTGYSPVLASSFINEFEELGGQIIKDTTYNSGSFDLTQSVSTIAADSLTMEGIYIPLSNKIDAAPLLSQMVQQNINTSVYGNQDWFFAKGFETSSILSDQLSFTSDFFIDYSDHALMELSDGFTRQTGLDINRNILYGYDIAEYLLSLINAGADTRASLKSAMESNTAVDGFHNNFVFGKDHINRFLNIVRYSDGKFELVDRFKSGE